MAIDTAPVIASIQVNSSQAVTSPWIISIPFPAPCVPGPPRLVAPRAHPHGCITTLHQKPCVGQARLKTKTPRIDQDHSSIPCVLGLILLSGPDIHETSTVASLARRPGVPGDHRCGPTPRVIERHAQVGNDVRLELAHWSQVAQPILRGYHHTPLRGCHPLRSERAGQPPMRLFSTRYPNHTLRFSAEDR
jgi:hypothetical protein